MNRALKILLGAATIAAPMNLAAAAIIPPAFKPGDLISLRRDGTIDLAAQRLR